MEAFKNHCDLATKLNCVKLQNRVAECSVLLFILRLYRKHISCFELTHHFYNFYHGIDTEVIEECGQVLFHLDAVVVHLGHSKDAHLALPPNLQSNNKI